MSNEDIASIGLTMQTDGVEKGIKSLETLAGTGPKVEKAMDGIEKAAAKTGKTLGTLGQGNGAGLDQVTASAGTAAASVQKVAAAAAEVDNNVKKVGTSANTATAGMDKMGVSAKQTAAALRGVPAQFTDIVTALQGGQAPMTVLLQQGGQLKDMFGGAVPAAKAIGGYIAGLVTPLTVGAAAAGVLGYAMYSASQDAKTLKDAVVLTNGAVGVSAGQLQVMAGHIGLNVSALNEFARSGSVSADAIESVTKAAIRFERLGGTAISDTVKAFEQLKKSPVEASIALNEKTNYLTASIYSQIKALDEQGRHLDAVKIAQEAYGKAQERMADGLEANLGPVDRMWKSIRDNAEGAWKAAKGFMGSDVPLPDRVAAQKKVVDRLQSIVDAPPSLNTNYSELPSIREQLKLEKERLFILQSSASAMAGQAKEAERTSEAEKAGIVWADRLAATRSNAERKAIELEAVRNLAGATDGKSKATQKDIDNQIALVNQKYDTGASVAAVRIAEEQKLQIIAQAQSQIDMLRTTGQMTEIEAIKATNAFELASYDTRIAAAQRELSIVAGKQDTEREQESIKQQIAEMRAQRTTAQIKGINDVTVALFRQTKAEMDLQLVEAQASDRYRQGEIDRANQLTQSTFDQKKALEDSRREFEAQVGLIGKSAQEQQIFLEKLRIQIDLEKELKKINETDYGKNQATKEADIDRAIANATEKGNQAAQRITIDYWKSTVESIQGSLTDGIINGIENDGVQGAIRGVRDAFVQAFNNLVLRPVIQAYMAPVAQGITSAFGISPNGVSGVSAATSGFGFLGSGVSAISAFGGTFATGFMNTLATGGVGSGLSAAGAMMGNGFWSQGLGMAAGSLAPIVGGLALVKSLTDYSITPTGNALTATVGSNGLVNGTVGTRADFTQSSSGILSGGTTHNSTWGVADAGTTNYINDNVVSGTAAVKSWAAAIGLSADAVDGYTKSIEISLTGLNPEQQKAAIDKAISSFVDDMVTSAFGGSLSAFAKAGETSSQTMQRVATDLTGVNTIFGTLGYTLMDVSTAGASAAEGLLAAFGGLQNFTAQTSAMYSNFYTKDEQKNNIVKGIYDSLTALGITTSEADIAGADRATWRKVLDAFAKDTGTEAGAKKYAALVAGANQLNPYLDGFADPMKSAAPASSAAWTAPAASINAAASTVVTAWQRAAEAIIGTMTDIRSSALETGPDALSKLKAQFAIEIAQASAGDLAAMQDLPTLAKSLDAAGKTYSKTALDQSLLTSYILDSLGKVSGAGYAGGSLTAPNYTGEAVPAATGPTQYTALAYNPVANMPAASVSTDAATVLLEKMEKRLLAIEVSNEGLRKMFFNVTDGGEHMNSKAV